MGGEKERVVLKELRLLQLEIKEKNRVRVSEIRGKKVKKN